MPIQDKDTLKTYFETGDQPTCAQFVDLIDSLQANSSASEAFSSAKSGLVEVQGTGAPYEVTARSAPGTAMRTVIAQHTTASAHTNLGRGTLGQDFYEVATTASARGHLGVGSWGSAAFEANTTASAVNLLGGIGADEATTVQVQGPVTASAEFITPDSLRYSKFAPKAFVNFTCAAAIQVSERVSSVTRAAAGRFKVTFAPALPTADYVIVATGFEDAAGSRLSPHIGQPGSMTAGSCAPTFMNGESTYADPNDAASVLVFCSGV